MTPTATKVSVGLSTIAGLSASTATYVGALVSALQGDTSQQTLALVGAGTVTLLGVIWSRGKQAVAHIHAAHKPAAEPTDPITQAVNSGTTTGTLTVQVGQPAPPVA